MSATGVLPGLEHTRQAERLSLLRTALRAAGEFKRADGVRDSIHRQYPVRLVDHPGGHSSLHWHVVH